MSTGRMQARGVGTRIALFGGALGAIFVLAWAAGAAWGPSVNGGSVDHNETTSGREGTRTSASGADAHGGHDASRADDVAQAPLVLRPGGVAFRAGVPGELTFAIEQDRTRLTRFDAEGGVQVHVIVVRSDLTGYQHLHPVLAGDRWSTPLTLPEAGAHVAFVDVERDGSRSVLRTRLEASGRYEPNLAPAPERTASVDGYDVVLVQRGDELHFDITRGGAPVELEEYVGALGHLVALRHDDVEYQHVHPLAGSTSSAPAFAAALERPGTYRLFLQFRHDGEVHTAVFDRTVRV